MRQYTSSVQGGPKSEIRRELE